MAEISDCKMPERLKYIPEKNLNKAGVDKVGVVVFVINQEGRVLVVQETGKEGHQGEIGVLCETRKPGETILDNTRAALIEEMGVNINSQRAFLYIDGVSYLGRFPFPEGKKRIHGDVVLIRFDGDGENFSPRNEVTIYGWMKPEDLAADFNLRPGVVPALEAVIESRVINKLFSGNGSGRQIFEGVDLESVFQRRKNQPDLKF